ncbi:DUF2868 domain-containing protein [Pseudomonas typographi]|uniref:DUF2868 domain-containing protein n=1 Tax=Pseudomonas typographi TaxID=2715964 RepID=A0ABR7YZD4_9PSED|nr:DUF2868 domain-containing protein [Pseudomonas typographi]MBD1549973.1 DUF2868 domain-containing protein [Pseudomonas typographi]MBD1585354.1 DUF2868 domain-containing protein [Pseudomonas typographi]MBD1598532.1 DUF2868 domain-containing protein [Pseudomonas typographi]
MDCRVTALEKLWLTEAIHWRETHAGPLEDSEAVRLARRQGGTLGERLQYRAHLLAERDGLLLALRRWRQGAQLALGLLLLLALASGVGMALAALGDGSRPVNVFWALGSLLGLNLLMLAGWCASAVASRHGAALGRLWLWLSARLARDAQAAHLAPALWLLLQRHHLARWLLGSAAHGLWLLSALSTLATLLLMLATRRYGFVWETTLLGSDTFVSLTHALGALPAALGFNVPDSDAIRASGDAALASARQPWASWLLGVLVCYGVLPRAVLALLCWYNWRRGRARLLAAPGHSASEALRERLMPSSERLGVTDPAPRFTLGEAARHTEPSNSDAVLAGIELDDQRPWPPPLPAGTHDAGVVDDHASRQHLLETLTAQPPARLLLACDPQRSADRGTLALLAELSRCAGATRVWLLPKAAQGTAPDPQRLADWQAALDRLGLPHGTEPELPTRWLEGRNE